MSDLLVNPAFQSSAVPLVVALAVAALLGFGGAKPLVKSLAGLAVLAGFLAASLLIFGLPVLPPVASGHKIPYLALLGAAAGLALDISNASLRRRFAVGFAVLVVAVAWLGWRKLFAAPSPDHLWMLLVVAGAALVLWWGERNSERTGPLDALAPMLPVALGLAGVAVIGASASTGQNAGALAAALGGLLVLNWPLKGPRRFGLGATARFTALVVLAALAAQLALFSSRTPAWSLLLLLPAVLAPGAVQRLIPNEHPRAALLRPVFTGAAAAVFAGLAVAAAYLATPASTGGY